MTETFAKKITYIVNTVILFMVFGLMAFFKVIEVPFLVYFSIPTACIYVFGYILIYNGKLAEYVWMVYLWLTFYMSVTTICLGYGFGFHLYCMSMIPVMFVTEYIAYKLERKSLKAFYVSLAVCVFYIICTGYVSYNGPVYETDQTAAGIFWIMNSVIVLSFLIFYSNWMIRLVIRSEDMLTHMAHIDKLTGLYNRHYMIEVLENLDTSDDSRILAMADIDHFKTINDNHGHNAGDYVLQKLSGIFRDNCPGADISRWGGEEFLILNQNSPTDADYFEKLRNAVENTEFEFEGSLINVTVTIGVASRQKDEAIDKWVGRADENLYYGKNHGRNTVIQS